ncbi:MAG: helix-turn-helix transcriptional regulator [Candidatus Eremiobacteraeota bacterium]|nr:helix-turn-helix transcriptional regulator [Candidatus Eremiobacteraeota bacterium]
MTIPTSWDRPCSGGPSRLILGSGGSEKLLEQDRRSRWTARRHSRHVVARRFASTDPAGVRRRRTTPQTPLDDAAGAGATHGRPRRRLGGRARRQFGVAAPRCRRARVPSARRRPLRPCRAVRAPDAQSAPRPRCQLAGATHDLRPVRGSGLIDAEIAVARGVAEGLTSREAGERPCISTNTVRAHVRHIFTKLDRSRVERARVVLETVGYSRAEVVGRLNPVLRGRGACFRRGHSSRKSTSSTLRARAAGDLRQQQARAPRATGSSTSPGSSRSGCTA